MLVRAATVVQVLHGLFYVLLQLLVIAAIILSFKFYCKFHCSCDPSLIRAIGHCHPRSAASGMAVPHSVILVNENEN